VNYQQFADPDPDVIASAREILDREGVDFEKPIAIYIGIFSPRYCIEAPLETAKYAPEWEFVFVSEGELDAAVENTAHEVANAHYLGTFAYRLMPGFLSLADVGFCFKDTDQPLKLKEYGAAGLPTVVRPGKLSNWHDEDELVFVDPHPEAIAGRLKDLRTDEQLYHMYREAGRQTTTE